MSDTPATGTRQMLGPEDWESAALLLLADRGLAGVAIEPLARRLGVTKGSFYWHFSDRGALLRAALSRWETQDRRRMLAFLQEDLEPGERLRQFFLRSSRQHLTHRVYAALLAAPEAAEASSLLSRVTTRRLRFLARAFRDYGLGATDARHRARLTYCAYVGFLHLQQVDVAPEQDSTEFDAYIGHVIDSLIPALD